MVNRCVAVGCSNTPSDRVSLFKFPRDPAVRKQWEKQVQRTRAQWKATEHSCLCSEHFAAEDFERDTAIAATFGIKKKRRLKPSAVPTIFSRQQTTTVASYPGPTPSFRSRYAVKAREPGNATPRKRIRTATNSAIPEIEAAGTTKRKRGAVEKRERMRVCSLGTRLFRAKSLLPRLVLA